MLENFGFVGLHIIVALIFAALMILLPVLFRFLKVVPHHPNAIKTATFECGMETIGKTWVQFNFRYYFYALIFVAFDVLVVFIYPLAVQLRNLGYSALIGIVVFIAIVLVGYIYAWKKRVLEWK
ncbi:MAG: NADH-quinone oxidoreductase subunit A [Dehalococcoidales bacterium]|nr:NADH-quinone oxidoreductase subunit A [Dehalococcoidales bacterium]